MKLLPNLRLACAPRPSPDEGFIEEIMACELWDLVAPYLRERTAQEWQAKLNRPN
jgi:hypothetical protein